MYARSMVCLVRIEFELLILPVHAIEVVVIERMPAENIETLQAFFWFESGLAAQIEGVGVRGKLIVSRIEPSRPKLDRDKRQATGGTRQHPGGHPPVGAVEMTEIVMPDLMRQSECDRSIRGAALDEAPGNVDVWSRRRERDRNAEPKHLTK